MPRIMIILPPGSALGQSEGVAKSVAELEKKSSFSFELVLIQTRSARLKQDAKVARSKLEQGDRIDLSFVEALSDNPSDLIEATNQALRLAAQAKLDAIVRGAANPPGSRGDAGALRRRRAGPDGGLRRSLCDG